MKLIHSCALVALCLFSITACVEDDRRKRRSKDNNDDDVVVIDTEEKKDGDASKPSKSCSPFDKDCEQEDGPMMSSEDGEFTIYHISQGACGEAERIFKGCDGSTPDLTLLDETNSQFCIREDYDAARCIIEHSTELCKMVDSNWEYESDAIDECVQDIYEARACDALVLKLLSCEGMEFHTLPEEFRDEGSDGVTCDAETKKAGECAMDYSSDVCAFYYWSQVDPDHEFEPGENLFYDCMSAR